MLPTEARYKGCLVGLAVGDALGVPLEFQPRKAPIPQVTEMVGGGPFQLKPGEWTDDTSMALCMAQSLIDKDGFQPPDIMDKFWLWVEKGYMSSNGHMFDIGDTTIEALTNYRKTGDALGSGVKDPKKAGNGSLMRLAPIPMFFKGYDDYIAYASLSSMLTHAAPNAVCACAYYSGLIRGALEGAPKEMLLSPLFCPNMLHWQNISMEPDVFDIAMGCYKTKTEDQIKTTGYVLHTLEAALWCFHTTNTFSEGLIKAVNLKEDSDTTGAVYGQLAGAYYGIPMIPQRWIDKIAHSDMILEIADTLYQKMRERYESKVHPKGV